MAKNNKDEKMQTSMEGFRFHEELEVAKLEISKLFHPADNVRVYRTFVTNPPSDIDTLARAYRDRDEVETVKGGLSQEAYNSLNSGKKISYISERSLSVNDSRESAELSGKNTYRSLAEKYDEETAEQFIQTRRGMYIGGVILRPGQAIITNFNKKGHAEVILNEGVGPNDLEIFEEITEYNYKDE